MRSLTMTKDCRSGCFSDVWELFLGNYFAHPNSASLDSSRDALPSPSLTISIFLKDFGIPGLTARPAPGPLQHLFGKKGLPSPLGHGAL